MSIENESANQSPALKNLDLDCSIEQEYVRTVSIRHRKTFGQFFTPEPISEAMAVWISLRSPKNILEPAAGTGVLVHAALKHNPNASITAVELDPNLHQILSDRFKSFANISIIRCKERLFPEILQDVVLLFADTYKGSTNEIDCFDFESFEDLVLTRKPKKSKVELKDVFEGNKPFLRTKLTPSENRWLSKIHNHAEPALTHVKFNIGYVSGNKNFFHPTDAVIEKFKLPKHSLHAAAVTGRKLSTIGYNTSELIQNREKVWLPNPNKLTSGEIKYIRYGEKLGFHLGHKTKSRNPWFIIPGVVIPALLITVFGDLPRLLINDARLPASNSLLVGRLKSQISVEEFMILWYTSVTRLGIELSVHSLGGGVLVMVPREADSILMPKSIGKKIPKMLYNELHQHLKRNDLAAAYRVGDKYLMLHGWDPADLRKAEALAIKLMNDRKKIN